jgi:S-adenosylmethionine:diacylglycerol 3-amino-3-carboxypropyl transferase
LENNIFYIKKYIRRFTEKKYLLKMKKMKKFFEKINYSACNEDSYSEIEALNINNNDIILCLTGS